MTKLWTIGYENVGLPDFVAALKAAKIKTVLDVREIANSRRAGFSKNILAAGLADAGIAYVHMKPLGTPNAGRDAAKAGDIKTKHRVIEKKLDGHEAQVALAEAAAFAKKGRVCLMCLEHDWQGCHRANVAKRLEAFGCEAVHLAPGG